jgi:hypothetical protein
MCVDNEIRNGGLCRLPVAKLSGSPYRNGHKVGTTQLLTQIAWLLKVRIALFSVIEM